MTSRPTELTAEDIKRHGGDVYVLGREARKPSRTVKKLERAGDTAALRLLVDRIMSVAAGNSAIA
jgi:hypothetical protein